MVYSTTLSKSQITQRRMIERVSYKVCERKILGHLTSQTFDPAISRIRTRMLRTLMRISVMQDQKKIPGVILKACTL
jgi:hypothetical protein